MDASRPHSPLPTLITTHDQIATKHERAPATAHNRRETNATPASQATLHQGETAPPKGGQTQTGSHAPLAEDKLLGADEVAQLVERCVRQRILGCVVAQVSGARGCQPVFSRIATP